MLQAVAVARRKDVGLRLARDSLARVGCGVTRTRRAAERPAGGVFESLSTVVCPLGPFLDYTYASLQSTFAPFYRPKKCNPSPLQKDLAGACARTPSVV